MFANNYNVLSGVVALGLLAAAGGASALTCSVSSDDWADGYVANFTVTNDGLAAISSWEVTLSFSQAPNVTGSWGADISGSGNSLTASNFSYNGNLALGESTTFGVQGTHSGAFQAPICSAGDPTPTPSSTPTPVPSPTPSAVPTPPPASSNSIALELEGFANQGSFSPFAVRNDANASGGQYVVWPDNGNQSNSTPSDSAAGQIAVGFNLSQATSVAVNLALNLPNASDDSFHYRMDSGTWSTQNDQTTNGWESLALGSYSLEAGDHTFTLQRREDGAQLDRVTLTAAAGEISAIGVTPVTPTPTVAPTVTPTPGAENLVIAINAGGGSVSLNGVDYSADQLFSGGSVSATDDDIAGVAEDALYQTERYGSYSYNIPVSNATYSTTLHFAEIFHTEAGARSFNVYVEGQQVLSNVDLYSLAGHDGVYSYAVNNLNVSDGALNIRLETVVDNAQLSGLAVSSSDGGSFIAPTPTPTPTPVPGSTSKWRIINTTDMGADPDDEQSLVRQLVMANEFDLEGIITSTGCWKKSQSNTSMVDGILDAYEQAYPNLSLHAEGFPSPAYLRSINVLGQRGYAMNDVGSGRDSAGSNLIISAVDKDDPRPVWATCWGGCNTIAQALWRVRNDRSAGELNSFISKLRVFDILGQGEAGNWIAQTFPDLLYIRATSVYGGWAPNDSMIDEIQTHGALGAAYPDRRYATEGDTPAFMHLAQPALNDPDAVDQGGWGGRFNTSETANIGGMDCMNSGAYNTHYMRGNTSEGSAAISKWKSGYDNDFLARLDWAVNSSYSNANHHPEIVINSNSAEAVMYLNASPGASVSLNASGSSDPDGDSLSYNWSYYSEPSSYSGSVSINNSSSASASVNIPANAGGRRIHIILTLRDNGSPNLYAYRRVVINVQ
ncbi:MAG: DUF1593 domain-containing protein [Cellvibrionaceae bacterium]|nr:DUF1593 domain-containing protein [Cellvibrionaceae bacterium]